jgi:RimJ/RimL family protein N-acetyltransferase
MRFWDGPAHTSIEQTRAFIARAVGPSDQGCVWAITAGSDRALGFISLYGRRHRIIGMGYMLTPAERGKGYVTEACEAALAFVFNDWDMHKVKADIAPDNAASAAVLNRLGFSLEGVLRQDFLYDGQYVDAANYGLLRSEWLKRN